MEAVFVDVPKKSRNFPFRVTCVAGKIRTHGHQNATPQCCHRTGRKFTCFSYVSSFLFFFSSWTFPHLRLCFSLMSSPFLLSPDVLFLSSFLFTLSLLIVYILVIFIFCHLLFLSFFPFISSSFSSYFPPSSSLFLFFFLPFYPLPTTLFPPSLFCFFVLRSVLDHVIVGSNPENFKRRGLSWLREAIPIQNVYNSSHTLGKGTYFSPFLSGSLWLQFTASKCKRDSVGEEMVVLAVASISTGAVLLARHFMIGNWCKKDVSPLVLLTCWNVYRLYCSYCWYGNDASGPIKEFLGYFDVLCYDVLCHAVPPSSGQNCLNP
jgi:hypothetical protein